MVGIQNRDILHLVGLIEPPLHIVTEPLVRHQFVEDLCHLAERVLGWQLGEVEKDLVDQLVAAELQLRLKGTLSIGDRDFVLHF